MKPMNRRRFFTDQSPSVWPRQASRCFRPLLGAGAGRHVERQILGANDRVRVRLIGCGGQGRGDLRKMLASKTSSALRFCDVDDENERADSQRC